MKTVLVTGIAGFLGSHVAERLIELGYKVCGIDSLEGGYESNVPAGAKFIKMDICDDEQVARLFYHLKPDFVIHCAAFAAENLSHNCRLHTYRSVVIGSANLVNAAINNQVRLFVSMSSIAVYGHQQPPFSEATTPMPMDPYGAAKLCMERDLIAARDFHGLNYIIFRPHNIIGTRQSLADSTRNVASIFIRQALRGNPVTVYGDGKQTRAFSPVSYVARVIVASLARESAWNRIFNIGGDRTMEVLWLAHMIIAKCASKSAAVHLPERREAKHASSDHSLVKQVFPDIEPGESIEDCIGAMIFEARKHRMPDMKPLPRIEVSANLNPAWNK